MPAVARPAAAHDHAPEEQFAMSEHAHIPEGCHSVQPYLMFTDCASAMEFYTKAFGARQVMCMKTPEGRVQHAEIELGDSRIMMADESPASSAFAAQHYGGSPISLMFYTEDTDAMCARALAAGATSLREPADQPYGDRLAGIEDPFGYRWWIGTRIRSMTVPEMQEALQPVKGTL
jgi:PhnB protein